MQNSLQQLLECNAFTVLDIPPSTPQKEMRRILEQARLEVSLGIREIDRADLIAAEQSIAQDPGCFEMRVFADWGSDSVLGPWAAAHADFLSDVQRLNDGIGDGTKALAAWVGLHGEPGLLGACTELAAGSIDLGKVWGDVAAEIVKEETVRVDEPVQVGVLRQLAKAGEIDVGPMVTLVTSSLGSQIERLVKDSVASRQVSDGLIEQSAGPGLTARFADLAKQVRELQASVSRLPTRDGTTANDASGRVTEKLVSASILVSTDLHNARLFNLAEEVLLRTLDLRLEPSEWHQVNGDLRTVRLARAHGDLSSAIERGDSPAAIAALEQIVQYAASDSDRAEATESLDRVRKSGLRSPALTRLQPITKAPSLSTINGVGTGLYGRSDYDPPSTSWAMTRYFTILFVPVFPLGRYRVREVGPRRYAFLGKLPLRRFDIWHRCAAAAVVALVLVWIIVAAVANAGHRGQSAGATAANGATGGAPVGAPRDLRVGDCVVSDALSSRAVSCGTLNAWRVIQVGQLTGIVFPSNAEIDRQAARICPSTATELLYPTPGGWAGGDRTLLCVRK